MGKSGAKQGKPTPKREAASRSNDFLKEADKLFLDGSTTQAINLLYKNINGDEIPKNISEKVLEWCDDPFTTTIQEKEGSKEISEGDKVRKILDGKISFVYDAELGKKAGQIVDLHRKGKINQAKTQLMTWSEKCSKTQLVWINAILYSLTKDSRKVEEYAEYAAKCGAEDKNCGEYFLHSLDQLPPPEKISAEFINWLFRYAYNNLDKYKASLLPLLTGYYCLLKKDDEIAQIVVATLTYDEITKGEQLPNNIRDVLENLDQKDLMDIFQVFKHLEGDVVRNYLNMIALEMLSRDYSSHSPLSQDQTDRQTQKILEFCGLEFIEKLLTKIGLKDDSSQKEINEEVKKQQLYYFQIDKYKIAKKTLLYLVQKNSLKTAICNNLYLLEIILSNSSSEEIVDFYNKYVEQLNDEALRYLLVVHVVKAIETVNKERLSIFLTEKNMARLIDIDRKARKKASDVEIKGHVLGLLNLLFEKAKTNPEFLGYYQQALLNTLKYQKEGVGIDKISGFVELVKGSIMVCPLLEQSYESLPFLADKLTEIPSGVQPYIGRYFLGCLGLIDTTFSPDLNGGETVGVEFTEGQVKALLEKVPKNELVSALLKYDTKKKHTFNFLFKKKKSMPGAEAQLHVVHLVMAIALTDSNLQIEEAEVANLLRHLDRGTIAYLLSNLITCDNIEFAYARLQQIIHITPQLFNKVIESFSDSEICGIVKLICSNKKSLYDLFNSINDAALNNRIAKAVLNDHVLLLEINSGYIEDICSHVSVQELVGVIETIVKEDDLSRYQNLICFLTKIACDKNMKYTMVHAVKNGKWFMSLGVNTRNEYLQGLTDAELYKCIKEEITSSVKPSGLDESNYYYINYLMHEALKPQRVTKADAFMYLLLTYAHIDLESETNGFTHRQDQYKAKLALNIIREPTKIKNKILVEQLLMLATFYLSTEQLNASVKIAHDIRAKKAIAEQILFRVKMTGDISLLEANPPLLKYVLETCPKLLIDHCPTSENYGLDLLIVALNAMKKEDVQVNKDVFKLIGDQLEKYTEKGQKKPQDLRKLNMLSYLQRSTPKAYKKGLSEIEKEICRKYPWDPRFSSKLRSFMPSFVIRIATRMFSKAKEINLVELKQFANEKGNFKPTESGIFDTKKSLYVLSYCLNKREGTEQKTGLFVNTRTTVSRGISGALSKLQSFFSTRKSAPEPVFTDNSEHKPLLVS